MPQSETTLSPVPAAAQVSPWRDIAVAALITLVCAGLAAHFELSEALFALTRRWEHFQLDEWPVAAFVLVLCLVWISWRRYQQALTQLRARRAAEARLATALAENRELAHQHLRIQEAERKHLARELHDELGQYLNAIKLDAVSVRESVAELGTADDDPANQALAIPLTAQSAMAVAQLAATAATRTIDAVDHVYAVVSDMIRRLRPAGLDELGLVAALENFLDHWRLRLPQTRLTLSVSGELDDLGELMNLAIYRLVQEAITNSSRHASASRIDIALSRGSEIVLTIADDGRGMDTSVTRQGFGLSGMRERVEMMGGSFSLESTPGRGLAIEARLPAC
jgi:two-component system sensor histidine kinase UhpB